MPSDEKLQRMVGNNKSIDDLKVKKSNQIKLREKEIIDCFVEYKQHPKFRVFLRYYGTNQAEDIFFEEHESPLEKTPPPLQEEVIIRAFNQLNEEYNYFELKDYERFKLYFKTCKFIADVIENNNSYDNRVAFLHAYKLMVLFNGDNTNRPFDSIDNFQNLHKTTLSEYTTPIHNILIYAIPSYRGVPPMPLKDLQQWQTLIHAGGIKVISLFQQAQSINHHLGRAPNSQEEALTTAAQLAYSRASENPKLASLCLQYGLSKSHFNRCLEIEQKRKIQDNLPHLQFDGETVGHPGFFIVKLPINDLRAYVLGHITNCCQSIGGDSEQCVIDGITLENCGFYVLLKGSPGSCPLTAEGQINNKDFKIVGQGYAWLSNNNVLVFDSWENLRVEYDAATASMLCSVASHLTSSQNTSIMAVSIGIGGKTPKVLGKDSTGKRSLVIHETMKEGTQYDDSLNQWVLAFNINLFEQLKQSIDSNLHIAISKGFTGLQSILNWLAQEASQIAISSVIYPNEKFIFYLNQLFLQEESYDFWSQALENDYTNLSKLSTNPENTINLLQLLVLMKDIGILNNEKASENFGRVLNYLPTTKLFNNLIRVKNELSTVELAQVIFEATINGRYPSIIIDALSKAQKNQLLTGDQAQANRKAIANHKNPHVIVDALSLALHNHLLNEEEQAEKNRQAIINHDNPIDIVNALSLAQKNHLLTEEQAEENRQAIISHANPMDMVKALSLAHENHLLTGDEAQENRKTIASHQIPLVIVETLSQAQCNPLLIGENLRIFRQALIKQFHPEKVLSALSSVQHLFNREELQIYFEAVVNHKTPYDLANALNAAEKNKLLIGAYAKNNFETIMKHEDLRGLACALYEAQQVNLLVGEHAQANFSAIVSHRNPGNVVKTMLFMAEQYYLLSEDEAQVARQAIIKHYNLEYVIQALSIAKKNHLFSGEHAHANYIAIINHCDPYSAARMLSEIEEHHLLDGEQAQTNFDAIIKHQNLNKLESILFWLNQKNIMAENNPSYFKLIVTHPNLEALKETLFTAKNSNLLSGPYAQINFEFIVNHPNQHILNCILKTLLWNDFFCGEHAQAHFELIVKHQNFVDLENALSNASQNKLLAKDYAQINFEIIIKHQNPIIIAEALADAQKYSLLTGKQAQENRETIINHQNPESVVIALAGAKEEHLLTEEHEKENLKAILKHHDPKLLVFILALAQRTNVDKEQIKANIISLINHQELECIAKILGKAFEHNLLIGPEGQANFFTIINHKNPSELLSNLEQFPKQETLTKATCDDSLSGDHRFFKEQTKKQENRTLQSPKFCS